MTRCVRARVRCCLDVAMVGVAYWIGVLLDGVLLDIAYDWLGFLLPQRGSKNRKYIEKHKKFRTSWKRPCGCATRACGLLSSRSAVTFLHSHEGLDERLTVT